jgi:Raf kinase inhibitor-like YbhB/YbcL family protein
MKKITPYLFAFNIVMQGVLFSDFSLDSKAIKNTRPVPIENTCHGKNISPDLAWEGFPAETKSFAIIVTDPDTDKGTLSHWVMYNIPPTTTQLPEALPKKDILPDGTMQGINHGRKIGYTGPCPPEGQSHRYIFNIYALDTLLNLKPGVDREVVEKAMKGHVIDKGTIVSYFPREFQR